MVRFVVLKGDNINPADDIGFTLDAHYIKLHRSKCHRMFQLVQAFMIPIIELKNINYVPIHYRHWQSKDTHTQISHNTYSHTHMHT